MYNIHIYMSLDLYIISNVMPLFVYTCLYTSTWYIRNYAAIMHGTNHVSINMHTSLAISHQLIASSLYPSKPDYFHQTSY